MVLLIVIVMKKTEGQPASSFVYYTTSDVWHVHPCRREPATASPFDLYVA